VRGEEHWNERGGGEDKEEEERKERGGRGRGGCTEMDGEVGIILPVRLGLYHTHRPDNA
jgi:hypothetical protein